MPAETSTDRLARIRAREQAATPGPWGTYYDGKGTYTIEAQPRLIPGEGNVHEGVVATLSGEHGDGQTYHNARFAAHAREDVSWLLDRNAVLATKVTEQDARIEHLEREREQAARQHGEEVDRLTRLLEQAQADARSAIGGAA